jgi:arylsulfatase A-like enzyme
MFDSKQSRKGAPRGPAVRIIPTCRANPGRRVHLLAFLLLTIACDATQDIRSEDEGKARPASVVLIVIDTLRADRLGLYGYARETSPSLDRFAQQAAVFERAIASSSWTLPSFASIYTGQHPQRHGAGESLEGEGLQISGIDAGLPTLAELFSNAGHATVAFANNPFLHEKFGVARGFDDYSFVPASNTNIRDAEKTTDLALAWIDRHRESPFFAMIHYFDPHMDYEPPDDLRGTFAGDYSGPLGFPVGDGAKIRNRKIVLDEADRVYVSDSYDEELLATDRALGRLLARLAEGERGEETFVILTSDHGEELFDHGSFEHGHAAYQELLHVPLVIWGPGIEGRRIAQPVSHVDLFATALDAAGIAIPGEHAGVSLLPAATTGAEPDARPIVADRTLHGRRHRVLIEWPYKSIDIVGRGESMLFDLAKDPGERNDLAGDEPDRSNAMIERFATLSPDPDRVGEESRAVALDDALREHLEALGYATPIDDGEPGS